MLVKIFCALCFTQRFVFLPLLFIACIHSAASLKRRLFPSILDVFIRLHSSGI
ncbi:hypothetical protein LY76DRAFT_593866 [Colletotrichum caudatum]|nr:hypothetical protein LY76DRAFT_593866 [Colletotrichum caudatum]